MAATMSVYASQKYASSVPDAEHPDASQNIATQERLVRRAHWQRIGVGNERTGPGNILVEVVKSGDRHGRSLMTWNGNDNASIYCLRLFGVIMVDALYLVIPNVPVTWRHKTPDLHNLFWVPLPAQVFDELLDKRPRIPFHLFGGVLVVFKELIVDLSELLRASSSSMIFVSRSTTLSLLTAGIALAPHLAFIHHLF